MSSEVIIVETITPSVVISQVGVQGPAGPTGPQGESAGFNFTQTSSSATWTINHNLGYYPAVTLYTSGGLEMEGEVLNTSLNQVVVYLATAISGSARLV